MITWMKETNNSESSASECCSVFTSFFPISAQFFPISTVQSWAFTGHLFLMKNAMWHDFCYTGWYIWSEYALNILSIEIIPTSFCWVACRKQKLAPSKTLQQGLFVMISGFWQVRQVFEHPLTFACSKSRIETLEKGVKYVQS